MLLRPAHLWVSGDGRLNAVIKRFDVVVWCTIPAGQVLWMHCRSAGIQNNCLEDERRTLSMQWQALCRPTCTCARPMVHRSTASQAALHCTVHLLHCWLPHCMDSGRHSGCNHQMCGFAMTPNGPAQPPLAIHRSLSRDAHVNGACEAVSFAASKLYRLGLSQLCFRGASRRQSVSIATVGHAPCSPAQLLTWSQHRTQRSRDSTHCIGHALAGTVVAHALQRYMVHGSAPLTNLVPERAVRRRRRLPSNAAGLD